MCTAVLLQLVPLPLYSRSTRVSFAHAIVKRCTARTSSELVALVAFALAERERENRRTKCRYVYVRLPRYTEAAREPVLKETPGI